MDMAYNKNDTRLTSLNSGTELNEKTFQFLKEKD
jgi:hypothetical protein